MYVHNQGLRHMSYKYISHMIWSWISCKKIDAQSSITKFLHRFINNFLHVSKNLLSFNNNILHSQLHKMKNFHENLIVFIIERLEMNNQYVKVCCFHTSVFHFKKTRMMGKMRVNW